MTKTEERLNTLVLGPQDYRLSGSLDVLGEPGLVKLAGSDTDNAVAVVHLTVTQTRRPAAPSPFARRRMVLCPRRQPHLGSGRPALQRKYGQFRLRPARHGPRLPELPSRGRTHPGHGDSSWTRPVLRGCHRREQGPQPTRFCARRATHASYGMEQYGSPRRASFAGVLLAGRPGPTQPVPSTRRRCIPSWRASTPTCCAGCARNTNGCGDDARHKTRGRERYGNGRASSPTGPGSPGSPPSGDQNDKSRVTRDCYARFREGRGLRCPRLLDNPVHGSDQESCSPSVRP